MYRARNGRNNGTVWFLNGEQHRRCRRNPRADDRRAFLSVAVVLGGRTRLGRRGVFRIRADVRGRGHRAVPVRLDRAERQAVGASVAVAGVVRVERVHDEDFGQRVSRRYFIQKTKNNTAVVESENARVVRCTVTTKVITTYTPIGRHADRRPIGRRE